MIDDPRLATDSALARSVLYRTFTLCLQPPTAETVHQLTSADGREALRAAAAFVDTARGGADAVLPAVLQHTTLAASTSASLAERYDRLFGHTARGPVCPFETEYGADALFQQVHELADIAGYYLAFGLQPRIAADARVDHIGCECEFMDFLCRKEALALELAGGADDSSRATHREIVDETRKAARRFLHEHLGRFGRAFALCLSREDEGGFFGATGAALFRFLGVECERMGVSPGPPILHMRTVSFDDAPMGCGDGQELIQIQGLRARG